MFHFKKVNKFFSDISLENIFPLSGDALQDFYRKLDMTCPTAAILSVVEPFASQKKLQEIKDLPGFLTEVYREQYQKLSLKHLRETEVDFSVSDEQQINVFLETLSQSKKHSWFQFRSGRITASKLKSACVTSLEKPSLSVIKNICYPVKINFKLAAIKWGLDHEKEALEVYEDHLKDNHQNLKVVAAELMISIHKPIFAASPDALVSCDCCAEKHALK